MFDAYVEILSGLIRIGPDAHRGWPEGPDPYECSVAFSANKGFATLKGLVVPRKYTLREARDIYDIVHQRCRELGLEPIYERIKPP